jgi:toxin FitB
VTYLTDANILSEVTKPEPCQEVVGWLMANQSELVIDSIILAEIRLGIVRLPRGRKRNALRHWFDEGIQRVAFLPWDREVALRWADLIANLQRAGRSLPLFDSMIAATALTYQLTVVTRNVQDFQAAEVQVLNPFE